MPLQCLVFISDSLACIYEKLKHMVEKLWSYYIVKSIGGAAEAV